MTRKGRGPVERLFAGIGLGLAVLLLAACGARIDTQLTIDAAGRGSRVMTLTLDSLDKVVGGAAAVDASILRHKPAEVDYSGLATGASDGTVTTTFTVNFANPAEYTQKMVALLAASDQEWTQGNTFAVEQNQFVQGATIEESFDSHSALQWMFAGLLADGVVDPSNSSNMFEMGSTTVTYDGVAYKESSPINFSKVVDRGFNKISMATAVQGKEFSRSITYWLGDKAVYSSAKDVFDGFFAEIQAKGATVVQDTEKVGVTWVVSLPADSAERLVELTNTALLSEEAAFKVTVGTVEGDPATSSVSVVDYADCTAICSPNAPKIDESLAVPANYTSVSGTQKSDDGAMVFPMSSADAVQLFHAVYSFTSVTTAMTVGMTGDIAWSGKFTAANDDVAALGDGFKSLLAVPDHPDQLSVTTVDGHTVYTVTINGADPKKFAAAFRAWTGQETPVLTVTDLPGANVFSVKKRITGDLGFSPVVASHLPAGDVEHSVALPFAQSFDTKSGVVPASAVSDGSRLTLKGQSAAFSATASGTTLVGLVAAAVLLLAVLGLALLALLMRKQILVQVTQRRAASAERRAAQATTHENGSAPVIGGGAQTPANVDTTSQRAASSTAGSAVDSTVRARQADAALDADVDVL